MFRGNYSSIIPNLTHITGLASTMKIYLLLGLAVIAGAMSSVAPLIDVTECGKSKGCYRDPPGCEPEHCEHIITWTPQDDDVQFEIDALNTKGDADKNTGLWTAVGFSRDKVMVSGTCLWS